MTAWVENTEALTTIALDAGRVNIITLRDGRLLTYAEYGDLHGVPVVELHGGGASHLSGVGYHREALTAGVRVIAVSRPGAAASTMHDGFTVAAYPSDIEELADQLALDRFVVMGNSNGAMFALSIGRALPDRVLGVLALNPATPAFSDPVALELTPMYQALAELGPDAQITGMRAQLREGLHDHEPLFAAPLHQFTRTTESEVIDLYLRATFLTQPVALEREVRFILQPWDFDIFDIKPAVLFISGQSEIGTPYNRHWVTRLPNAAIEEPPGGHICHLAPEQRQHLMAQVVALHASKPRG